MLYMRSSGIRSICTPDLHACDAHCPRAVLVLFVNQFGKPKLSCVTPPTDEISSGGCGGNPNSNHSTARPNDCRCVGVMSARHKHALTNCHPLAAPTRCWHPLCTAPPPSTSTSGSLVSQRLTCAESTPCHHLGPPALLSALAPLC